MTTDEIINRHAAMIFSGFSIFFLTEYRYWLVIRSYTRDMRNSGVTMPKTYTTDTKKDEAMVGDKVESVMAAKRTGAQQDDVMPENTPKINVDPTVVFWGIV